MMEMIMNLLQNLPNFLINKNAAVNLYLGMLVGSHGFGDTGHSGHVNGNAVGGVNGGVPRGHRVNGLLVDGPDLVPLHEHDGS